VPPARYKVGVLSALMQRFPERCYVLIGDSGEQDPEAYGEIATMHPDNVGYVFIRKVKDGPPHNYDTLFEKIGGLTKGKVKVFESAADLAKMPTPTCGKATTS
jgi:phosphatidate phosphatase APP1